MANAYNVTNSTLGADRLAASLSEAIQNGHIDIAKELVTQLTNCHFRLNISISKEECNQGQEQFPLTVQVEDRLATCSKFDLSVKSSDTVADLKKKMLVHNNIPFEVQKWIIGKKIPDDKTTLRKCGVDGPGHTIFLYVGTAHSVQLLKVGTDGENCGNDSPSPTLASPIPMTNILDYEGEGETWLMNSNLRPQAEAAYDPEETRVEPVKVAPRPINFKLEEKPKPTGWECPQCTLINLPTRPGCQLCSTNRPEEYVIPYDYELTDEEVALKTHEEELERLTRESHETALRENFRQWLILDDLDLIPNTETFTCPICLEDFEPGGGITLRECLHQFCKDCLQMAVSHSEEPNLKCPYTAEDESCDSVLQEREIRGVVPEDVFIRYLQRSLDQAESQAANSFHCKSTDCNGWCLYEDDVNFFTCPICNKQNCLTCKVIHEGMNCKEYQVNLAMKAANDVAARQTQQLIERMLTAGEAIKCPQCQIVVQKKDGCDWIKCSVCKTEICWVTKGRRWGPNGPGDTSAGCKCGVGGRRCHPTCANCH